MNSILNQGQTFAKLRVELEEKEKKMFFVESSSTWPITVGIVSKKKRETNLQK